jgi:hypothetical protein
MEIEQPGEPGGSLTTGAEGPGAPLLPLLLLLPVLPILAIADPEQEMEIG